MLNHHSITLLKSSFNTLLRVYIIHTLSINLTLGNLLCKHHTYEILRQYLSPPLRKMCHGSKAPLRKMCHGSKVHDDSKYILLYISYIQITVSNTICVKINKIVLIKNEVWL